MLLPDPFIKAVEAYAKPVEDEAARKNILDHHLNSTPLFSYASAIEHYQTIKGKEILSSGCSSGGFVSMFLEKGATRAYGVETDPALVNLARLRFAGTEWESQVQIDSCSGEVLPYPDDTFDIISSLHVMEHTQDNGLYLSEIFRVLKPGGILFLEIPNRYFRKEQHTQIPYIHYLPMRFRKWVTGCITKTFLAQKVTPGFLHRLNLMTNLHFPSPAQLMDMVSALSSHYDLKMEDAFYHIPGKANFRQEITPYLIGPHKKMNSFRMVVRKLENKAIKPVKTGEDTHAQWQKLTGYNSYQEALDSCPSEVLKQAVRKHLKPMEGQREYDNTLFSYIDYSRFVQWSKEIEPYFSFPGKRILSSGCGTGGCLYAFLEKGAEHASGIEVESHLVDFAKLRFEDSEFANQVDIRLYSGGTLPYDNESFDLVYSMHVLEHTEDNEEYLREHLRVLKPGGLLFLEVPNRYFVLEQHVHLRYIHWLSKQWRNRLIPVFLSPPFTWLLSEDRRNRMRGMIDFNLPSPAQLMDLMEELKEDYPLEREDAFFHNPSKLKFKPTRFPYLVGKQRKQLSFRIIFKKRPGD